MPDSRLYKTIFFVKLKNAGSLGEGMDDEDERSLLKKLRRSRGDDTDDLDDEFETPGEDDILLEKQVREKKRKHV